MEEKKVTKISLSTFFLILAIIAIIIMSYFIYKLYNEKTEQTKKASELQTQINNLNSTIKEFQEKIDSISTTKNDSETTTDNKIQNDNESSTVSYITIEIEDIEAEEKNQQGIEYKNKKITNKEEINSIMEIINSATPYTAKSFIPDFGDAPPLAKIYLTNGESYTVAVCDEFDDNGNEVNLMNKWDNETDDSNKTLYKVNKKLGEQIEKLFND